MKIILFGTGQIYREKKRFISSLDEIIGFLDNNQKLWGIKIDGIPVYCPEKISELSYDRIVLTSNYATEMKKQLLELKCDTEKIMHYREYIDLQKAGELQVFFPVGKRYSHKKSCLIITTDLEYNGGSIAAVYGALALQKEGYESVIAAPMCDPALMKEIHQYGITVMIYKNLNYARKEELFWIDGFQYIIVNTLQMSCCAIEIAKNRKVILWIHEPQPHYKNMVYWNDKMQKGFMQKNLEVYAVSSVARDIFLTNFKLKEAEILPLGIPDEYQGEERHVNRKFTFAMIGTISEQKGQDIFFQAIQKMGGKKAECNFLIIGRNLRDSYGQMIEKVSHQYTNIQLLGELPHEKVMDYWHDIDVLVVASREETLSIVATEALMLGKVCIVSEVSGIAKYMTDHVNGFLFSPRDTDRLAEIMLECIEHEKASSEIRKEARKVYESFFSMEIFGSQLNSTIHGKN